MDGRCADCRWWSRFGDKPWGGCTVTAGHGYERPLSQKTKAYAYDTVSPQRPNVVAILATSPDFGCTQWTPEP